jgi:MFS transporter, ACDE family, multidrug resistance protein
VRTIRNGDDTPQPGVAHTGDDGRDDQGVRAKPPLLLIFVITMTGITNNTLITPSISEILTGLDAGTGLSGILVGAGTLPGIVLAPVIGILADRYGRREVLVPCLAIFGIAGGLAGLSPSIWWLAVLRLLQGVGSAGLINLAVVTIGDHWEGNRRAQIIGWNAAVLTASLAVLPTFGGALTDLGGWRTPFAVYPFALATAVLVWRLLPRGQRSTQRMREQIRDAVPLLRRTPVLLTIAAATATFALIFGLLLTVLPQYLASGFGLPASFRGAVLGLPALANASVSLSLGAIRRRVARRHLLVAATALFAVGLATVGLSSPLWGVAVGLLVFGVGEGFMVPNLQDIATGSAPSAQRGTSVALFVSGARLGQTIGPLVAGAAFAAVGAPVTFAAGAAVALVLGIVLATYLREHAPEDI